MGQTARTVPHRDAASRPSRREQGQGGDWARWMGLAKGKQWVRLPRPAVRATISAREITFLRNQSRRIFFLAGPSQDCEPRPLLIAIFHCDSCREATAVGVPEFSGPGIGEGLGPLERICQLH